MNFIVLNEHDNFPEIKIKGFKEVDVDGDDRVDGIFGKFTPSVLEQLNRDSGRGEDVFREQWLLRDRGILFMVFEVPENILHDENVEIIEKIFELYDKENFYIETWSYCFENKWEYFLICLNKNLGFYSMDELDIFPEEKNGINQICKKIEKIIEI